MSSDAMRNVTRGMLVGLTLALGLACGSGEPEINPAPPLHRGEQPVANPPREGKTKQKRGKRTREVGEHVVKRYLEDCHHVFPPRPDDPGDNPDDIKDECKWRPFEQNCDPDPFQCMDSGESCKDACRSPCSSCQDKCGDTCDGCKKECPDGGQECLEKCARSRSECRDSCIASLDACLDVCDGKVTQCEEEKERTVSARCPNCDAVGKCLQNQANRENVEEFCKAKFPDDAPECFTWCAQQ